MLTEYPTCSQLDIERSNPQDEALEDEFVSRNANEPDSASLHCLEVVKLSEMSKPEIIDEVIFECNQWTSRGDWGWRAEKALLRNLGDPEAGNRNRESDDSIVVRKGLIHLERRGSAVSVKVMNAIDPACFMRLRKMVEAICSNLNCYARIAYRRAVCGKTACTVRRGGATGMGIARPLLSTLLDKKILFQITYLLLPPHMEK